MHDANLVYTGNRDGHSDDWSVARDLGRFGDVCPADQVAAHPWMAEIHTLSSKAGDQMLTAVEKSINYVISNPLKSATGLFASTYVASEVGVTATAAELALPALVIGGTGVVAADGIVNRVTGKMLGCYDPLHRYD